VNLQVHIRRPSGRRRVAAAFIQNEKHHRTVRRWWSANPRIPADTYPSTPKYDGLGEAVLATHTGIFGHKRHPRLLALHRPVHNYGTGSEKRGKRHISLLPHGLPDLAGQRSGHTPHLGLLQSLRQMQGIRRCDRGDPVPGSDFQLPPGGSHGPVVKRPARACAALQSQQPHRHLAAPDLTLEWLLRTGHLVVVDESSIGHSPATRAALAADLQRQLTCCFTRCRGPYAEGPPTSKLSGAFLESAWRAAARGRSV